MTLPFVPIASNSDTAQRRGEGGSVHEVARALTLHYISRMCGKIIQSNGPLRYAIVDGMNLRDSRVHNYPPRWNAAPSQELLVIRRKYRRGVARPAALGADPVLVQ